MIGLPDPHWGEAVTAVVVPAPNAPCDPEALRDWARSRIAGFKVPKTIVFLPDLPQTSTGKVDKRALIARLTAQSAGTDA